MTTINSPEKQRIAFELDPQIIHHIIYSQAGSIGKAIIELIMNSVDAGATVVDLTLTKDGFTCKDDGNGFANRQDVLRYFGRFGTPHEEGDATFGRFRLGRGQIMAHAKTVWESNSWRMDVDTRVMGYGYDLETLETKQPGCSILGEWYEALSHSELMSATQEIRDLVRYTPVLVSLNGSSITRSPANEKWDFEDEHAYYRVKVEGSVSIYNQGVLVRHDPGHFWGAGGLIVTKKAIALNVSRTEILRQTCPIWKAIAKTFGKLAEEISAKLGEHRRTEARREKFARALLSADPNVANIYATEEVITILPGNKHVTLLDFMRRCMQQKSQFSVVDNSFDIPKGEAIARQGIAIIVHPKTLTRFGCYTAEDLREALTRIREYIKSATPADEKPWLNRYLGSLSVLDFSTLKESFLERTVIVSEKDVLDKESRRPWIALRTCLEAYVSLCTGGHRPTSGSWARGGKSLKLLIGQSTNAQAWTDGSTYIAIDLKQVERLKREPMMAAAYIFSLVEHEICHEGDSLDCGHDEAFHERFHDLTIKMAAERQRYLHIWLKRYTSSLENEGKSKTRGAWGSLALMERAGSGREKRGLPAAIEGVDGDPLISAEAPAENMAFIKLVNTGLIASGRCPPPPDWNDVFERARANQSVLAERSAKLRAEEEQNERNLIEAQNQYSEHVELLITKYANLLGISCDHADLNDSTVFFLENTDGSPEAVRAAWEGILSESRTYAIEDIEDDEHIQTWPQPDSEKTILPPEFMPLVREGETLWSLERNAAAAGFHRIPDYLKWRAHESQ